MKTLLLVFWRKHLWIIILKRCRHFPNKNPSRWIFNFSKIPFPRHLIFAQHKKRAWQSFSDNFWGASATWHRKSTQIWWSVYNVSRKSHEKLIFIWFSINLGKSSKIIYKTNKFYAPVVWNIEYLNTGKYFNNFPQKFGWKKVKTHQKSH